MPPGKKRPSATTAVGGDGETTTLWRLRANMDADPLAYTNIAPDYCAVPSSYVQLAAKIKVLEGKKPSPNNKNSFKCRYCSKIVKFSMAAAANHLKVHPDAPKKAHASLHYTMILASSVSGKSLSTSSTQINAEASPVASDPCVPDPVIKIKSENDASYDPHDELMRQLDTINWLPKVVLDSKWRRTLIPLKPHSDSERACDDKDEKIESKSVEKKEAPVTPEDDQMDYTENDNNGQEDDANENSKEESDEKEEKVKGEYCHVCEFNVRNLMKHQQFAHSTAKRCIFCPKTVFYRPKMVEKHMTTRHKMVGDNWKQYCSNVNTCNLPFHKGKYQPKPIPAVVISYQCNFCSVSFNGMPTFASHMQTEHKIVTSTPEKFCKKLSLVGANEVAASSSAGVASSTPKSVSVAGRPTFEMCNVCFCSVPDLARHDRDVHSFAYSCRLCTKGFFYRPHVAANHARKFHNVVVEDFTRHFYTISTTKKVVKHSKGKDKCIECGLYFKSLSDHAKVHTSVNCKLCQEYIYLASDLGTHLKVKHNIDTTGDMNEYYEKVDPPVVPPSYPSVAGPQKIYTHNVTSGTTVQQNHSYTHKPTCGAVTQQPTVSQSTSISQVQLPPVPSSARTSATTKPVEGKCLVCKAKVLDLAEHKIYFHTQGYTCKHCKTIFYSNGSAKNHMAKKHDANSQFSLLFIQGSCENVAVADISLINNICDICSLEVSCMRTHMIREHSSDIKCTICNICVPTHHTSQRKHLKDLHALNPQNYKPYFRDISVPVTNQETAVSKDTDKATTMVDSAGKDTTKKPVDVPLEKPDDFCDVCNCSVKPSLEVHKQTFHTVAYECTLCKVPVYCAENREIHIRVNHPEKGETFRVESYFKCVDVSGVSDVYCPSDDFHDTADSEPEAPPEVRKAVEPPSLENEDTVPYSMPEETSVSSDVQASNVSDSDASSTSNAMKVAVKKEKPDTPIENTGVLSTVDSVTAETSNSENVPMPEVTPVSADVQAAIVSISDSESTRSAVVVVKRERPDTPIEDTMSSMIGSVADENPNSVNHPAAIVSSSDVTRSLCAEKVEIKKEKLETSDEANDANSSESAPDEVLANQYVDSNTVPAENLSETEEDRDKSKDTPNSSDNVNREMGTHDLTNSDTGGGEKITEANNLHFPSKNATKDMGTDNVTNSTTAGGEKIVETNKSHDRSIDMGTDNVTNSTTAGGEKNVQSKNVSKDKETDNPTNSDTAANVDNREEDKKVSEADTSDNLSNPTQYKCNSCQSICTSLASANEHLHEAHNFSGKNLEWWLTKIDDPALVDTSNTCEICGESSVSDLDVHRFRVHAIQFECKICQKILRPFEKRRHLKIVHSLTNVNFNQYIQQVLTSSRSACEKSDAVSTTGESTVGAVERACDENSLPLQHTQVSSSFCGNIQIKTEVCDDDVDRDPVQGASNSSENCDVGTAEKEVTRPAQVNCSDYKNCDVDASEMEDTFSNKIDSRKLQNKLNLIVKKNIKGKVSRKNGFCAICQRNVRQPPIHMIKFHKTARKCKVCNLILYDNRRVAQHRMKHRDTKKLYTKIDTSKLAVPTSPVKSKERWKSQAKGTDEMSSYKASVPKSVSPLFFKRIKCEYNPAKTTEKASSEEKAPELVDNTQADENPSLNLTGAKITCALCDKKFVSISGVKSHLNRIHQIKSEKYNLFFSNDSLGETKDVTKEIAEKSSALALENQWCKVCLKQVQGTLSSHKKMYHSIGYRCMLCNFIGYSIRAHAIHTSRRHKITSKFRSKHIRKKISTVRVPEFLTKPPERPARGDSGPNDDNRMTTTKNSKDHSENNPTKAKTGLKKDLLTETTDSNISQQPKNMPCSTKSLEENNTESTNEEQPSFLCTFCGLKFSTISVGIRHCKDWHNRSWQSCLSISRSHESDIPVYLRSNKNSENYCKVCLYEVDDLSEHQKMVHSQAYSCKTCTNMRFMEESIAKRHCRSFHGASADESSHLELVNVATVPIPAAMCPQACPICTSNIVNLDTHIQRVHGLQLKCKLCQNTYALAFYHLLGTHLINEPFKKYFDILLDDKNTKNKSGADSKKRKDESDQSLSEPLIKKSKSSSTTGVTYFNCFSCPAQFLSKRDLLCHFEDCNSQPPRD